MPEVTEAPVVETPDVPDVEVPQEDIQIELTPGKFFPLKQKVRKVRNSDKQYTRLIIDIPLDIVVPTLSGKLNEANTRVLEAAIMREIIIPACDEATAAAFKTDESGEEVFDGAEWVDTFWSSMLPGDRRRGGGVTIKDLRNRLQEVSAQLAVAVNELRQHEADFNTAAEAATNANRVSPHRRQFVPEEKENRCGQLLMEVTDLSSKIEAKSRVTTGGRPKGAKNKSAKVK
jgi:hypothetical protein